MFKESFPIMASASSIAPPIETPTLHVQPLSKSHVTDALMHPDELGHQHSAPISTLEKLQEQYAHLNRENLAVWREHIVPPLGVGQDDDAIGPYRQWSHAAVGCFVRNANCEGCYYNTFFSEPATGCQMNEAVKHLLKKLGPPNKRHITRLS
jgi:hypothetical protein